MALDRCSRRHFLRCGTAFAPLAFGLPSLAADTTPAPSSPSSARVAVVACRGYGAEVPTAFATAFDLLGGLGRLVKGKTVAIKLNMTGADFSAFHGRPAGESVMTHYATARALAAALLAAGARLVRFVESAPTRDTLAELLAHGGWDVRALEALGKVEFENTRNLGSGKSYADIKVPGDGLMFTSFQLNRAYADTDVMVSLAKLKQHVTAGVTLSMKNLFGITPCSIYGDAAGTEEAIEGRTILHTPGYSRVQLPAFKWTKATQPRDPGVRVPRITTDLCAARPVHLAIIDGICAMSGGEGPWCGGISRLKLTQPGVLIVGLNPVSADAVGTAVMGFNPRANRGEQPFPISENHLLLAEKQGLGTADLAKIDVRGLTLEKAKSPYPELKLG